MPPPDYISNTKSTIKISILCLLAPVKVLCSPDYWAWYVIESSLVISASLSSVDDMTDAAKTKGPPSSRPGELCLLYTTGVVGYDPSYRMRNHRDAIMASFK